MFLNFAPCAGKVHEVRTFGQQVFPNFAPKRSWSKDMVRTLGTFTASCRIVFILPCLCRFRHQQEGETKAVEEMPEDKYRPLRIGCRCARMDVRTGDMGKVRTSGRFRDVRFCMSEARGEVFPMFARGSLRAYIFYYVCLGKGRAPTVQTEEAPGSYFGSARVLFRKS